MIVDCFDCLLNVFYAFNKIYKITTVQKEFETTSGNRVGSITNSFIIIWGKLY